MRHNPPQPALWRVFLPLLPYAVLLAVLLAILTPFGLARLAWPILATIIGGLLLYRSAR